MKKITLLINSTQTVGPSPGCQGRMPNTGMPIIMASPEMAKGTGSPTQSTTPASRSPKLIFAENESSPSEGRNAKTTTTRTAAIQHSALALTDEFFNMISPAIIIQEKSEHRREQEAPGGKSIPLFEHFPRNDHHEHDRDEDRRQAEHPRAHRPTERIDHIPVCCPHF